MVASADARASPRDAPAAILPPVAAPRRNAASGVILRSTR